MIMADFYIGVDVSKAWIDVHHPETGAARVKTDGRSLAAFARRLAGSGGLVVLEATGGYERPVMRALDRVGVAYHRANPARARHFAKASGMIGKTDRADARSLARMGQQLGLAASRRQSAAHHKLKALVARRRQLVEMRKQDKTRLQQCDDRYVAADCRRLIAFLDRRIAAVETEIDRLLADGDLAPIIALMRSVPGIGPVAAATLAAELPELGQVDRRAVAALAGVAPIARDSGQRQGKRRIGGGRPGLRSVLYMAALQASRHNHRFRAFRKSLEDRGKTPKQAIIAVARKLLVILNAMLKSGQHYNANAT